MTKRKSGETPPSDKTETEFAQRLKRITSDYSQAEIARRTQTRITNVNRYLNGTRIPGVFLSMLVSELKVNPTWLLTGEGAVYLSDVGTPTQDLAARLLESVEAMKKIAQLRLSSISGKAHLGVIRKLNEAMGEYNRSRERLNDYTRDILQTLFVDLHGALDKRELSEANDLRSTIEQLIQFCHDPEMQRQHDGIIAYYEYQHGQIEEAMALLRRAFLQRLSTTGTIDDGALKDALKLCLGLSAAGRYRDVLRLANAALALADGIGNEWQAFLSLRILRCSANTVELNLRDAITEVMHVYPRMDEHGRTHYGARAVSILWHGGVLKGHALMDYAPPSLPHARFTLYAALYDEDMEFLKVVVDEYVGHTQSSAPPNALESLAAVGLLGTVSKRANTEVWKQFKKGLENYEQKRVSTGKFDFPREVWTAQVALACGRKKDATAHTMNALTLLDETDPEVTYQPVVRATLWRTVLRLDKHSKSSIPAELVTRARTFFDTVDRAGFTALRP